MSLAHPNPSKRSNIIALSIFGGLIVALILAVGGYVAYTKLSGDEEAKPTLAPVTSKPKEAWAWTSDQDVSYAQRLPDDGTLVSLSGDTSGIVALDPNGKERWRDEKHPYNLVFVHREQKLIEASWYVARASSNENDAAPDSGSILFDFDGNVVWDAPDGRDLYGINDDGTYLAYDDSTIVELDPETDTASWTVKGSPLTVTDDAIYAVDGDNLVRYDRDSGDDTWRAQLPAGHEEGLDEYSSPYLYATDEMVLVASGSLLAYAAPTGKQLWTESHPGEVIRAADDRFVVVPSPESDPFSDSTTDSAEEEPEGPFPIYGPGGQVGDIDLATTGPYLTMDVIDVDGREVNFHESSGTLFDADGKVIDDGYDNVQAALSEGGYTVDGSTIGYRDWSSDEAAWTLELDDVESLADEQYAEDVRVGPADGALYVTDKRTVRLFR